MYVFVNTRLINKVYKETFVFAANWKTVCFFYSLVHDSIWNIFLDQTTASRRSLLTLSSDLYIVMIN